MFRLALRRTEGLIRSIVSLLGLAPHVPDHSTLSGRAATPEVPRPLSGGAGGPSHLLTGGTGLKPRGAGEWLPRNTHPHAVGMEEAVPRRGRQHRPRCGPGVDRERRG